MLTSKVAKRYAQGLLDFSQESGATAHVFGEMKDVVKIMNQSKELNQFFATPFIDYKKKMNVANQVFVQFSQVSKNFISLIIKQGRERQLKNIAQEFINKVEDLQGIQRIKLTSAMPLAPQNIDSILRNSGMVKEGSQFDLQTNIKPEILGGYILRVGDQQIDASVQSKLNQLRKDFHVN